MNITDYNKIPTFDEALAIVENSKGFSHSVQTIHDKEVHSFKYNISYQGMWDDLSDGKVNMRGLTFIDGKVVALPYPKFWNLGENIHVQDIDVSTFTIATEKVDGSLISFFKVGDELEMKTMKSVFSDTANEAREYSMTRTDIRDFASLCLENNISPMFEYISDTDQGRIVIDYNKKDLILLGARDLSNGTIYNLADFPIDIPFDISTARLFNTSDEVVSYMADEGVEGVVMILNDGTMVKLKTDWYCRLHRILDKFNTKNILEAIVTDSLDDIKSALVKNNLKEHLQTVRCVEQCFHNRFKEWLEIANKEFWKRKTNEETKKDIALSLLKKDRVLAGLVFAQYDEKDLTDTIKNIVKTEFKDRELDSFSPF
jgi:RNA ligase